jgi:hypothetical protein
VPSTDSVKPPLFTHGLQIVSDFPPCHDGQFQCGNGQCIPLKWRCDGYKDCKDRTDEENCTRTVCPGGKFQCPADKECIDEEKVCDDKRDCSDGADEKGCCEYLLNYFSLRQPLKSTDPRLFKRSQNVLLHPVRLTFTF